MTKIFKYQPLYKKLDQSSFGGHITIPQKLNNDFLCGESLKAGVSVSGRLKPAT